MTVLREQSRRQNSAYRSGCHKLLLSITSKTNEARCAAGLRRLGSGNGIPPSPADKGGQIRGCLISDGFVNALVLKTSVEL